MTPTLLAELNRLGVLPKQPPKPAAPTGPIAVVRDNKPDF